MNKFKSQLNQILSLSAAIIILSLFASCEKEPDGLGLDILPGQDDLVIQLDSLSVITANTVKFESMPSYDTTSRANPSYWLGDYTNPAFGITKASMFVSFYPDTITYSFGTGYKADSLSLQLKLDSLFGDANANIEFNIWELKKDILFKSNYNTNLPVEEYKGNLVATKIMKYNDTLKIKLDKNLADKIIQIPSTTKDEAGLTAFQYKFKGFYIEVKSVAPGLYLQLDPWRHSSLTATKHETRLTLYYQNSAKDSLQYKYFVDTRVNKFSHDYTNTPIATALQNTELSQKVTYVQGLAGLGTRVSIPSLSKWTDLYPVSITKAELVIPVESVTAVGDSVYPKGLYIKAIKSDNNLDFIEYGFGQSFLNGEYDSDRKAYIFNLAKHIQKIANNKNSVTPVQNTDFMILADSYKVGLTNTFRNVGLNFSRAKLYIVYSKQ